MPGTVLVTGAAGGLGRALLPALGARGWRPRCLVHRRDVEGADSVVRGDVRDPAAVREALRGTDAAVHLAAVTHARSARRYRSVNVGGTRCLAHAARELGLERIVHVSSRAISPRGGGYSRSKALAERAVLDAGVRHVTLRLAEVYGTGGGEGLDRMVALAAAGRPVPVLGRGADRLCPVFVEDAVAAIAAALDAEQALGQTYTIGGECLSARELAEACVAHFGAGSRVVRVPLFVASAAAALGRVAPLPVYPDQVRRLRAPKDPPSPEARGVLGFEPRSFYEGLRAMTAIRSRKSGHTRRSA